MLRLLWRCNTELLFHYSSCKHGFSRIYRKELLHMSRILMSSSKASEGNESSKCRILKEEEICKGKWLALNKYHWQDQTGRHRIWEVVSRTTRNDQALDSVAVIATVTRDSFPDSLILIKQFRPPLKTYTIEMPAGLVESTETEESAALRELKEETGYTGVISGVGRNVALDPGISNSTMKIVTVKVDGNIEINQSISTVCGIDGEHTEVLLIPLSNLDSSLKEFASAGMIIDSRVEAFSFGLSICNNKSA